MDSTDGFPRLARFTWVRSRRGMTRSRAGRSRCASVILSGATIARWSRGIALSMGHSQIGNATLGARLEALTKEYGVDILVGEATANAAGPGFVFREVDVVRVKGRAGAAPVFELVGRAGARVDGRFVDALALYRKREFTHAQQLFTELENDDTAAIMAKRCAQLASAPPAEDWDGVYEQRSK